MATDKLTPAQRLAVERAGGPILVSAAAGSGKTKVIVERLMRRILSRDEECDVNDFLLITFTRKAASELRARIAKELAQRLAEDPENIHLQKQQSRIYLTQISTVHAFCADLLREFAYELDLPADFRILEETEARGIQEQTAEDLLEERYESLMEDPGFQDLVDGLGAGRDDRRIPKLLLSVYRTAQCRLYPAQWMEMCRRSLSLEGVSSAEQTPWGASLVRQFQSFLSAQTTVFREAVSSVEASGALSKYLPIFRQNLEQLEDWARLTIWDDLCALAQSKPSFGRLPPLKDCEDPELQARVRAIRTDTSERVQKRLLEFSRPSEEVLGDLRQTGETLRALLSLTESFTKRYDAEKRRLHALDFHDLEHGAVRLLLEADGRTPTAAAKQISTRFREIMVDEYQDTNEVQDSLFRAISREGKNRFMVGDVKQSIYRFRLADPTIFLRKYRSYPDAETVGAEERQRILLSHNFRSGLPILEAVNAVFSACMSASVGGLAYGPTEALHPGAEKTALPQTQVELHCLSTKPLDADAETPEYNRAEAEFVARRIRRLLTEHTQIRDGEKTRDVRPGDIAILLRSPKNVAGVYLEALRSNGIPAASDSGESILDTAEVETMLCLLKVIDNAHQDIPLAGALLSPIFGISATELALAKAGGEKADLYDRLQNSPDASSNLKSSLRILSRLREQARELPLHALFAQIRKQTGLEAVYGAMDHGAIRLENLNLFSELAARFAEGGKKSLHQFLNYVQTLREEGGVARETAQTNAVTVMSIHKSKGLEFPVVFLSGLSKRFNTDDQKAMVQFDSELGVGCSVYDRPTHTRFPSIARAAISRKTLSENLSEELRVLYVAMTRAEDLLIMTFCSGNLRTHLTDMVHRLSPATKTLTAAEASCLGDWILQTALLRTEAGALHAVAGKPEGTSVSEIPWLITYEDLSDNQSANPQPPQQKLLSQPALPPDRIRAGLSYAYPSAAAIHVPVKVTATQLKGRNLDAEAAEGSAPAWHRSVSRRPNLIFAEKPLTAAQRGIAMHQAMQYLDFSKTASPEQIRFQLDHMVEAAFLTRKQADSVDPEKLLRVFRGDLGRMIREADRVVREFKFSVLIPSELLYPESGSEKIMLQGVTDCCLIHGDALTVVDFKTDRVAPGKEAEAGERYRSQLNAYSLALSRIFGLPVSGRLLYFFATDTLLKVD